ncbi:hypothetical protein LTR49_006241 [Elasticomyces elasticus]|nr:hypothetical protein LTR49_006241 [Elasticomyces elasticus]KAK5763660.1 hypothetical protein LTS12_006217 [Elasticomyces elasticus]
MATSPLLSISAELRNRIYELVLSQEEPIIVRGSYEDLDSQYPNVSTLSFDRTAAQLTALIKTCKTIHTEASSLPYFLNTFCTATIFIVHKQEAWNYVEQKEEVEIDVRKLFKSFKDLANGFLERSKALEKEEPAGEKNWLLAWRLSRMSMDMDRLRTGWESKGGIEGRIEHWLALNDE